MTNEPLAEEEHEVFAYLLKKVNRFQYEHKRCWRNKADQRKNPCWTYFQLASELKYVMEYVWDKHCKNDEVNPYYEVPSFTDCLRGGKD